MGDVGSLCVGGILRQVLGYSPRRRVRKSPNCSRRSHSPRASQKVQYSPSPSKPKTILSDPHRLLAPSQAIRRTIIRHLIIILDLSNSMMDRDMRPTRFDLSLEYTREFVNEWFDQNPLGQIGVVGMRAGVGERVGEMSGL